jgi:hypothetical protein
MTEHVESGGIDLFLPSYPTRHSEAFDHSGGYERLWENGHDQYGSMESL